MVKQIYFLALIILTSTHFLIAGSQKPKFSFRVHVQAGDQIRDERVVPVALVAPNEIIRVHKLPALTEKYIVDAMETSNGGVILGFNQAGKHSLETVTSTEMGQILVVIMNGRVIYDAQIDMPMSSGRLLIPTGLTETDILMLKAHIKERQRL